MTDAAISNVEHDRVPKLLKALHNESLPRAYHSGRNNSSNMDGVRLRKSLVIR